MLTHLNAVVRSRVGDVQLFYKGSGVGLFQDDLHSHCGGRKTKVHAGITKNTKQLCDGYTLSQQIRIISFTQTVTHNRLFSAL